jgi:lipoic acid synthetase
MDSHYTDKKSLPKPPWLKVKIPSGAPFEDVRKLIEDRQLHTVCQSAQCPNIWECFSRQTATFMILGDRCTRDCRFCAVPSHPTEPPDPDEPSRVAAAVKTLGLSYVVVTSVTRDDLPDGGAAHFAETIQEIRCAVPTARVEVLVPDFQGSEQALFTVTQALPDVLNHNLETVPRLYPRVRPQADYRRSLKLLERVRLHDSRIPTKSGLMLGLGESFHEVESVLGDLLEVDCRILTLGQYLQPSIEHLPVERFVSPDEFEQLRQIALRMGFREVASGPLVRSSYHAGELYHALAP